MPKCSAFGCNYTTKSKGSKKNPNISLHNFPKDEKLRKRWIKAARCIRLSKDPRLCSQHFLPDDFEISVLLQKKLLGHSSWKRKLKDSAVPTIFAFTPVKKPRLQSEQRAKRRQRQQVNILSF